MHQRNLVASIALLGICASIFFSSCRKIAESTEPSVSGQLQQDFFTTHRSDDITEQKLVEYVKRQEERLRFVQKAIRQVGYPRWDKMIATTGRSNSQSFLNNPGSSVIYYIPFVRGSENYVNAAMAITATASDTSFAWFCDWQYAQIPDDTISNNAEQYAVFFMALDKNVFRHQRFKIFDSTLFNTADSSREVYIDLRDTHRPNHTTNLLSYVETCQEVMISFVDCPYQGISPSCTPNCDRCLLCMSSYIYNYCWGEWLESGANGGGNAGGGGTPPAGGGTNGSGGSGSNTGEHGPGWGPLVGIDTTTVPQNPCAEAATTAEKATNLAKTPIFSTAKTDIQAAAAADNQEHAISFGKGARGAIITSPMVNGGHNSVPAGSGVVTNQFAHLHNHPGNSPQSSGDVYSLISSIANYTLSQTGYVVTANGTVYALVIINMQAALNFQISYPKRPNSSGYEPEFPTMIADEYYDIIEQLKGLYGKTPQQANEMAIAFILTKYNTGVGILKQNATGDFKRLITTYDATTTENPYTLYICP